MSVVELSDEENVAILAETFTGSLTDLRDRSRQLSVLTRIHRLLGSSAPQRYIYEFVRGCDELEVVRAGDDLGIFCSLAMGIPGGDEHYNVLLAFYVDPHEYPTQQLTTFDAAAEQRLREVTSFDDVEDVGDYLEEMNAFSAEDR